MYEEFALQAQHYKVHVDASYDSQKKLGKIAWVTYIHDQLVSTNVIPCIRHSSIQSLEELVFKVVDQVYCGAKIFTDSAKVWETWKSKHKNRIYLINSKDNLADDLLRGKGVATRYKKVPTYRFEYVKVRVRG